TPDRLFYNPKQKMKFDVVVAREINCISLDDLVEEYLDLLCRYTNEDGDVKYSEIKYAKILIADAVLSGLGILTQPPPEQESHIPGPTRKDPLANYVRGFVYLALNERNGLVKIGWSKNPNE